MNPTSGKRLRDEFEAWASNAGYFSLDWNGTDLRGSYASGHAREAWDAWQAAYCAGVEARANSLKDSHD